MLQGRVQIGLRAEAVPLRFFVPAEPRELALGIAARLLLDARAGLLRQVGARFSPEPQFLAQCVLWVLSTLGCPGQWVAECSVEIQEIQRRQREEGC